jgi:NADPH2:quinone reductase
MRALLCKEFGPAEKPALEEVAPVAPGKGQVVVEVKACSVNFPDTLIIEGKYQFKPDLPFVPGTDVAGIIKKVGGGVPRTRVGERAILPRFSGA